MGVYALLMILVYPVAMPLTLFLLLWQHRARLNPPGVSEAVVVEQRREDPVLAADPVTAFSMLYRPKFWYYEVRESVDAQRGCRGRGAVIIHAVHTRGR